MEVREVNGALAFQNDAGTIYVVTPISDCAAFLGVSGVPVGDPNEDLTFIYESVDWLTKLVLFVEENQKDLIKLTRSLGFKQEGRLKKASSTGDYLVFGQYR